MASAQRRFLPLLLGFIVLALLAVGCLQRSRSVAPSEPTLSKQAIVTLAARSISSAGMPEPPLRRDSTRADRKEYLAASQGALDQIRKLAVAKDENRHRPAKLSLDSQNEQILAISRMLAVELADSIDRSDPGRALQAIRTASAYARFVSQRSVPDWLASAGVADALAVGVKSVAGQIDSEMAETLTTELTGLEAARVDPSNVLAYDSKRIRLWLAAAQEVDEPLSPESIQLMFGVTADTRATNSDSFLKAVEPLAPSGFVEPDVFEAECRIAAEMVCVYLDEPRGPEPSVDSIRHPIAAHLLSVLRPTFAEAPRLEALRAENWRLLALTIRIAASDLPDDLSAMGDLAISPVTQMPFEYVRRKDDFDLARPRVKAGSAS
ncbi:MAG: hypothetical protein ABIV13_05765 [Fimbriimonadales bacterium]